jgi:hypothetical protein
VSREPYPTRATDVDLQRVKRDFGIVGAEEDNHEPGAVRSLWLPCDPKHRVDCECKATEVQVVDARGHRWSNAPEAELCRGCQLEALVGRPCPLHPSASDQRARRSR